MNKIIPKNVFGLVFSVIMSGFISVVSAEEIAAPESKVLLTISGNIKNTDFNRYPIIIAYRREGELMTVRNLGPLWLMFPFDQHPELLNETNKSRAVWQLTDITVR